MSKVVKIAIILASLVLIAVVGVVIFVSSILFKTTNYSSYKPAEAVIIKVERNGVITQNRTGLIMELKVIPQNDSIFYAKIERAFYSPDVYMYHKGTRLKVRYEPHSRDVIVDSVLTY